MFESVTPPVELGHTPDEGQLPDIVRDFYRYWLSKGQGHLPRRSDMRIDEMARFLPNLAFVTPHHDPDDFYFRLMGSELVLKSRQDRTGQFFSEIGSMDRTSTFWRRYAWVRDNGRPLFSAVEYVGGDSSIRYCEDLILPLSECGDTTDNIVTFVNYIGLASR